MSKARIVRFKRWYQIQMDGYTLAQTLCKEEAYGIIEQVNNSPFPVTKCGINLDVVPRKGQTFKKITIYP